MEQYCFVPQYQVLQACLSLTTVTQTVDQHAASSPNLVEPEPAKAESPNYFWQSGQVQSLMELLNLQQPPPIFHHLIFYQTMTSDALQVDPLTPFLAVRWRHYGQSQSSGRLAQ